MPIFRPLRIFAAEVIEYLNAENEYANKVRHYP